MRLVSTSGAATEVRCPARGAGKVLLRQEVPDKLGVLRAVVQDELSPDEARRVAAWLYAAAKVAEGNQSPVSETIVREHIEPWLERAGWQPRELARLLRTRFGVEDVWTLPRNRASELVDLAKAAAEEREREHSAA